MAIEIDEENLKKGLLGLLVGLIEVIQEVLEGQALRRMESGSLAQEEVERLGNALMELNQAIQNLKEEHDLGDVVRELRKGLDEVAEGIIDIEGWIERGERS